MEDNNKILIGIFVLVVALIVLGAFILTNDNSSNSTNITNSTNSTNITKNVTNATKPVNSTQVNNTTNNTNKTYKVYNPQNDSYVEVIGEAYDSDVGRWYTYDVDGVRYYNTRIWVS